LAQKIKANGLEWRKDGRDMLRLIDLVGLPLKDNIEQTGGSEVDMAQLIFDTVLSKMLYIEAAYGWDHLHQTQAQEESVMEQFVVLWMMYNGVNRKFALAQLDHA